MVAHGESYVQEGVEDVVFCFLRFPSGLSAHLHLSWLDPHKERRFTVVGSRRMATFDDMALEGKLNIYDKGFDQDAARLRRVHHPHGRHLLPADPQPRAAADRVRALRGVRRDPGAARAPTARAACASSACSRSSSARSTLRCGPRVTRATSATTQRGAAMETWDVRSLEIEAHHPQVLRSDAETRAIAISCPPARSSRSTRSTSART